MALDKIDTFSDILRVSDFSGDIPLRSDCNNMNHTQHQVPHGTRLKTWTGQATPC